LNAWEKEIFYVKLSNINYDKNSINFLIEKYVKKYLKERKEKLVNLWYTVDEIKLIIQNEYNEIKNFLNDSFLLQKNWYIKYFIPASFKWFLNFIIENYVVIWKAKAKWVFPIVEFFDYQEFWTLIYERKNNPNLVKD